MSLSRRPSIAPVPAMLEANGIEIKVETESDTSEEVEQNIKVSEDPDWSGTHAEWVIKSWDNISMG